MRLRALFFLHVILPHPFIILAKVLLNVTTIPIRNTTIPYQRVISFLRSHIALKHRSAIKIQRNLRSVLCRICLQRDQIASAERDHAAKSIQIWRRYIVLQRKKRNQEAAAARSNPLRDTYLRGLKIKYHSSASEGFGGSGLCREPLRRFLSNPSQLKHATAVFTRLRTPIQVANSYVGLVQMT